MCWTIAFSDKWMSYIFIYEKNWRPISLLNQDSKLISGILAERLKDQNGSEPKRFIGININRILNLIALCKENYINGILLNIDF